MINRECSTTMLDQMKTLIREEDLCVLATSTGEKPYCSLMAYVTEASCEEIYMVTHRNSKKYRNMLECPSVSLLIDSRGKTFRNDIRALTIEGTFKRVETGDRKNRIRRLFLKTHTHLRDFMEDAEAEIFCVKVESFLLLNGISEAHFHEFPS